MYTVDYFIDKFEKIPANRWTVYAQQNQYGQRCAIGHCMPLKEIKNKFCPCFGDQTQEGKALLALFVHAGFVVDYNIPATAQINNGGHPNYKQPTPKQRILAALYDIKKLQQPTIKEVDTIVGEFIPITFSQIEELQSAN